MGLLPKHHGELNKINAASSRYDELRVEYKNDAQALQQIDVYDPSTTYHDYMHKYIDAMEIQDADVIANCEAWFNMHYGLL
jgi:hypothetical protein